MNEDFLVSGRGAERCHPLYRAIGCFVDRFAIDREPLADGAKALLEFGLNHAVGLWSHIKQESCRPGLPLPPNPESETAPT